MAHASTFLVFRTKDVRKAFEENIVVRILFFQLKIQYSWLLTNNITAQVPDFAAHQSGNSKSHLQSYFYEFCLENMMRFLAVMMATLAMTCLACSAMAEPILEMSKTRNFIEFSATFSDCDAPHTFKVQDGAMVQLSKDGATPIRFIVKRHSKNDFRFHLIQSKTVKFNGKEVPSLSADSGASLSGPVPAPLAAAGIANFKLKRVYPMAKASSVDFGSDGCDWSPEFCDGGWDNGGGGWDNGGGGWDGGNNPPPPPPPPPVTRCCTFTGCNGTGWRFCTAGDSGCGGDSCGGCCVN